MGRVYKRTAVFAYFINIPSLWSYTLIHLNFWIPEGRLLLATGGDDNCLVISIVTLLENNTIKIHTQCQELSAHAAQITGKVAFNFKNLMLCLFVYGV